MKTITRLNVITLLLLCIVSSANAQLPPTAPPDLTYDAEDVLSFFSEKYGEARELSSPNWGQASTWDYTATGDDEAGLLVIKNLAWLPIQLKSLVATKQYEYFHIDVFCNEATDFRVGFHSNYPVNGNEVYFTAMESEKMVAGKWYSIDYPISDLKFNANDEETTTWMLPSGSYADANLLRFGNATDKYTYSTEIYMTNLILFNGTPTCVGGVVRDGGTGLSSTKNDSEFKAYVVNNELVYSAKETIKTINIYNISGQNVKSSKVNALASKSDVCDLASGVYVVSAELVSGYKVNIRVIK